MRKLYFFLVIIFLFISPQIIEAEKINYLFYCGEYKENVIVPLFGDNVNVREKPDIKASSVRKLPIGKFVKIINKVKETLILNNYEEEWYLVEYEVGGKYERGYVWGGLISKAYVEYKDSNYICLMGIIGSTSDEGKKWRKIAEIRLLNKKNEILDSLKFEPIELSFSFRFSYSTYSKFLGKKNIGNLLFFYCGFNYEACDYPYGKVLFAIDPEKNKIIYVTSAVEVSSDWGRTEATFIFPDDKGGKKDNIGVLKKFFYIENPEEGVEKLEKTEIYYYKYSVGRFEEAKR